MITPLLYVWGDDELVAERLVGRFATALAGELGTPLERWDLRGDLATAATGAAQLHERLATATLFGGGTLAVVTNPGALVRRNDTRDRVIEAISMLAAGNALAFVEAAKSGAKGPGSKRLVDAVKAAGGAVAQAMAPRPTSLGAWIETEARDRGLSLAPGAARALADRLGSRVTQGDVERRYLSRIASGELDKLALRHALDGGPVTADDVEALVAEATPGSVWALTDAVGERRVDAALTALDRLIDITPEPVLLAVLHRRVVELLELGDRLAAGTALPAAAREMGIASEYRAKTLAGQARLWSTAELVQRARGTGRSRRDGEGSAGIGDRHGTAPAGVHDVGRRPRCAERQRRAARRPRLTPGPDTAFRPSVGGRPGLFLEDEVALDREDAAAFAEIEEFDQLGIDVELRAVLAQSAGDAEAQPLTPVGQPECRVEPGRDEPVITGGTAVAKCGHARTLSRTAGPHHDPTVLHLLVRGDAPHLRREDYSPFAKDATGPAGSCGLPTSASPDRSTRVRAA